MGVFVIFYYVHIFLVLGQCNIYPSPPPCPLAPHPLFELDSTLSGVPLPRWTSAQHCWWGIHSGTDHMSIEIRSQVIPKEIESQRIPKSTIVAL